MDRNPYLVHARLTHRIDPTHAHVMKPKKNHLPLRLLATSLLLSSAVWAAQPVSITNAGFEDPVLANGAIQAGAPGWSAFNSGTISVLNPATTDLSLEAPEGANVGVVTSTAAENGFSQILTSQFQADATYAFTAKVANTLFTTGFPGYRVQLVANGTVLAEDDNSQAVAEDAVVTSTFNYSYNAGLHAALVGQPLEIRLLSKGLSAAEELAFDDVQLTVTLANPAANPGGPYSVNPGASLSLNGSGSLPSDGQTITTYEWDLNNNNTFGDVTGVTPAAISDAVLIATWGMAAGPNTIQLRVTDSAAKTSTASGTVILVDTTTFTGPNKTNGDNWNVPGNWDVGVPSGSINVAIPASKQVTADNGTAVLYTGDLTIAGYLQIGFTSAGGRHLADFNALGTPGTTTIHMQTGGSLVFRAGTYNPSVTIPAIALDGNASLTLSTSTEPVSNFDFPHGINGPHTLTLKGKSNQDALLSASNTFGELIITSTEGSYDVFAKAANSLNGNVTLQAAAGLPAAKLFIDVADSISNTGTLALNGSTSVVLITMNANDSVGELKVNNFQYPAGTYGRVGSPGAPTNQVAWIAGDSVLTVLNSATDTTAPLLTITDNLAGGPAFTNQPITYTLTFSEPVVGNVTVSDFDNASTSTVSIDSVNKLSETVIEVKARALTAGSFTLRLKSSAVFEDLSGNNLAVPVSDDTTLTVNATTLQGQLGVWKQYANGGINPATGNPWQAGDTYRLAFVTSTTRNATSTDIAEYNTFVQGVAASSTSFPNLGNGSWKVIGSTATTSALVNTGTDTGTGVAVILLDGSTVFATNNADIWNGSPARTDVAGIFMTPYFDQNGIEQITDHSIFTGTNSNGTSHATQPFGASPVNTGKVRPNNNSRWMVQFNATPASLLRFFALSDPLTISAIGGGGNTFANWIATYPGVGASTALGDDADGDGIDNGVENFFGTDPSVSNRGLVAGAKNGNTFTFTHPQNATPASDLTAAYQWSKDLATFYASGASDGSSTVTFTTQADTPATGTTTVTATVTGAVASRLFVNIKVTRN